MSDADWYYSVELQPGVITQGAYPATFPNLPRLMMRDCDLAGMACLDVGTMEGLTPVLMGRAGASRVVAVDASDYCRPRRGRVKRVYGASYEFRTVGSMYDLAAKIDDTEGFDLIVLAGVLYHVFSPLAVLAGVRGLLRKQGVLIVATNVVNSEEPIAEFNVRGRLQPDQNTFWYPSLSLFEYWLRLLRLAPVDATYLPHDSRTGYASVLCRAVDHPVSDEGDRWMATMPGRSWEEDFLVDWRLAESRGTSRIEARTSPSAVRPKRPRRKLRSRIKQGRPPERIEVARHVAAQGAVKPAQDLSDSYTLRLGDQS